MSKPRFYVRKFLNRPGHHELASVLAEVSRRNTKFSISDCSRQIDLTFDSYDKKALNNSLNKAQILIDTLTEFKKALAEEYKLRDGRDEF